MVNSFDFLTQFGFSIYERIKEIGKRCESPIGIQPLEFMGKRRDLPVIEIRIEIPIYRLSNGRTLTMQEEYLANHSEHPDDFFTRDVESTEAQLAQHEILLEMVDDQGLLKAFKDGEQQTDPLISTNTGIIVNGNRRLCAWRELYYKDKITYKHFETIRLAILPECDEKAILELEERLQVHSEKKAQYKWHTIAKMIERDINAGKEETDIANSLSITKARLHELLDMQQYAITYLEKRGCSKQWSLVDDKELAFSQMVKSRKKIESTSQKEFFESVAFALTDDSQSAGGRLYGLIPEVKDNLDEICASLEQKLEERYNSIEPNGFDLLAPELDDSEIKMARIAVAAGLPENAKIVRAVARNVIETQKALKAEQKSEDFLLDQVTKSATILCNAVNIGLSKENVKTRGIEEQLASIQNSVKKITEWLYENEYSTQL
ncbi:hypothetical protein [Desulforamulus ruminis]|uniref:Uncharacterized protein n=1 Tax=Desulforamulus ruminis (strain ATCC 23193 / DSM 2154 / NCIMB 8452 / DL) TaxID=696281 RepID=F6DQU6_DESRL|nr:hypothetical protein [Desulforamulus ruminis]AEG58670.1 hypothetical protein Desru_0373 [Desulforamulus ruminis DSM 2154]